MVRRRRSQQHRRADSGQGVARAGHADSDPRDRIIEGLTFKGKCYSALAQMLGTRSITERLAHLLLHLVDIYGVKDRKAS